MRRFPTTAIAVLLLGVQPNTAAAEIGFSGELAIASDYVFRGVSQTLSDGALQMGASAEGGAGWYVSAWTSNVDFTTAADADDGAQVELDFEAGLSRDLGRHTNVTVAVARYTYPGAYVDYDYAELLTTVTVNERHSLVLGYSDDVFGTGADGLYYEAATSTEWRGMVAEFLVGYYDVADALGDAYGYGSLALGGELGSVSWRLSYVATDTRARDLFTEAAVGSRAVLALGYYF